MAKLNRTCVVCGKKYSYCPSCDEDYLKPSWYGLFHDENCMNIFETLCKQSQGYLTIAETKELLLTYDLSAKTNFPKGIQEQIELIMNQVATVVTKDSVHTIKEVTLLESEEIPTTTFLGKKKTK